MQLINNKLRDINCSLNHNKHELLIYWMVVLFIKLYSLGTKGDNVGLMSIMRNGGCVLFVPNFNCMENWCLIFCYRGFSFFFRIKHSVQNLAAKLLRSFPTRTLHSARGAYPPGSKFPLKFRTHTTHTQLLRTVLLFLHGCSTAPLPAHALRAFSILVKGLCRAVFLRECVAKLIAFIPHVFSCSYLLLFPAFSDSCFAAIFI